MPQLTKYGVEGASDFEDNQTWFWDALGDIHDQATEIIRCHLASLNKVDAC
jgi:hypothetical protein